MQTIGLAVVSPNIESIATASAFSSDQKSPLPPRLDQARYPHKARLNRTIIPGSKNKNQGDATKKTSNSNSKRSSKANPDVSISSDVNESNISEERDVVPEMVIQPPNPSPPPPPTVAPSSGDTSINSLMKRSPSFNAKTGVSLGMKRQDDGTGELLEPVLPVLALPKSQRQDWQMRMIVNRLRKCTLLKYYSEEVCRNVIHVSGYKVFHTGDLLFRQGGITDRQFAEASGTQWDGGFMCILLQGEVSVRLKIRGTTDWNQWEMVKKVADKTTIAELLGIEVSILSAGDCVGEAVLFNVMKRSATAMATTETHALMLPKSQLRELLKDRHRSWISFSPTLHLRLITTKLEDRNVLQNNTLLYTASQIMFFRQFVPELRNKIVLSMRYAEISSGDIFRFSHRNYIMLIFSGVAAVHEFKGSEEDVMAYMRKDRTAEYAFGPEVTRLHAGDALCPYLPYSGVKGTCIAVETCHCLVLSKRDANRLLGEKIEIILTAQSMLHLLWKPCSKRSDREIAWLSLMLRTMKFFGQLPYDLVKQLAEKISFRQYVANKAIVIQGRKLEYMLLMLTGSASAHKKNTELSKINIDVPFFSPDDTVHACGEIAEVIEKGNAWGQWLLKNEDVASHSIVARELSDVILIDREMLMKILNCKTGVRLFQPLIFKKLLEKDSENRREEDIVNVSGTLLDSIEFFKEFPATALRLIASKGKFIEALPGRVLLHQGQPAKNFFIVLYGQIEVRQRPFGDSVLQNLPSDVPLSELEKVLGGFLTAIPPGNGFGEISILTDAVIAASVYSASESQLLMCDVETVKKLAEICDNEMVYSYDRMKELIRLPSYARNMFHLMGGANYIRNLSPYFQSTAQSLLHQIARTCSISNYDYGDIVMKLMPWDASSGEQDFVEIHGIKTRAVRVLGQGETDKSQRGDRDVFVVLKGELWVYRNVRAIDNEHEAQRKQKLKRAMSSKSFILDTAGINTANGGELASLLSPDRMSATSSSMRGGDDDDNDDGNASFGDDDDNLLLPGSPSNMNSPKNTSGMLSPRNASGMLSPRNTSGMLSPRNTSGALTPRGRPTPRNLKTSPKRKNVNFDMDEDDMMMGRSGGGDETPRHMAMFDLTVVHLEGRQVPWWDAAGRDDRSQVLQCSLNPGSMFGGAERVNFPAIGKVLARKETEILVIQQHHWDDAKGLARGKITNEIVTFFSSLIPFKKWYRTELMKLSVCTDVIEYKHNQVIRPRNSQSRGFAFVASGTVGVLRWESEEATAAVREARYGCCPHCGHNGRLVCPVCIASGNIEGVCSHARYRGKASSQCTRCARVRIADTTVVAAPQVHSKPSFITHLARGSVLIEDDPHEVVSVPCNNEYIACGEVTIYRIRRRDFIGICESNGVNCNTLELLFNQVTKHIEAWNFRELFNKTTQRAMIEDTDDVVFPNRVGDFISINPYDSQSQVARDEALASRSTKAPSQKPKNIGKKALLTRFATRYIETYGSMNSDHGHHDNNDHHHHHHHSHHDKHHDDHDHDRHSHYDDNDKLSQATPKSEHSELLRSLSKYGAWALGDFEEAFEILERENLHSPLHRHQSTFFTTQLRKTDDEDDDSDDDSSNDNESGNEKMRADSNLQLAALLTERRHRHVRGEVQLNNTFPKRYSRIHNEVLGSTHVRQEDKEDIDLLRSVAAQLELPLEERYTRIDHFTELALLPSCGNVRTKSKWAASARKEVSQDDGVFAVPVDIGRFRSDLKELESNFCPIHSLPSAKNKPRYKHGRKIIGFAKLGNRCTCDDEQEQAAGDGKAVDKFAVVSKLDIRRRNVLHSLALVSRREWDEEKSLWQEEYYPNSTYIPESKQQYHSPHKQTPLAVILTSAAKAQSQELAHYEQLRQEDIQQQKQQQQQQQEKKKPLPAKKSIIIPENASSTAENFLSNILLPNNPKK